MNITNIKADNIIILLSGVVFVVDIINNNSCLNVINPSIFIINVLIFRFIIVVIIIIILIHFPLLKITKIYYFLVSICPIKQLKCKYVHIKSNIYNFSFHQSIRICFSFTSTVAITCQRALELHSN